jgi:O-acetyl-ADP-ribose deacetylase (regulator of RNase III)
MKRLIFGDITKIVVAAVRKFIKTGRSLDEVLFGCFDRENHEICERLLKLDN